MQERKRFFKHLGEADIARDAAEQMNQPRLHDLRTPHILHAEHRRNVG